MFGIYCVSGGVAERQSEDSFFCFYAIPHKEIARELSYEYQVSLSLKVNENTLLFIPLSIRLTRRLLKSRNLAARAKSFAVDQRAIHCTVTANFKYCGKLEHQSGRVR